MAQCPVYADCAFVHPESGRPGGDLARVRGNFCDTDYESCARYRVWEAADNLVPSDLLPEDQKRADTMIAQGETIRFTARRKDTKA